MKTIELKAYTIAEKRPEDGQECWVSSINRGYDTMQVYNESYNCWDTSDGDDYDFDVNTDDVWVAMPNLNDFKNVY